MNPHQDTLCPCRITSCSCGSCAGRSSWVEITAFVADAITINRALQFDGDTVCVGAGVEFDGDDFLPGHVSLFTPWSELLRAIRAFEAGELHHARAEEAREGL